MLSLTAFADELEREKARQRTYDAMRRKAEARHVTGGACFGYVNVDVTATGPDGKPKRQYVRRRIVQEEAAVVRRIFELCAAGGVAGPQEDIGQSSRICRDCRQSSKRYSEKQTSKPPRLSGSPSTFGPTRRWSADSSEDSVPVFLT